MKTFEVNPAGFFDYAADTAAARMDTAAAAAIAHRDAKRATLDTVIAFGMSAIAAREGWGTVDAASVSLGQSAQVFDAWRLNDSGLAKTQAARLKNARLCLLGLYKGSAKIQKAFATAKDADTVQDAVDTIRDALPSRFDSLNKLEAEWKKAKAKKADAKASAAAAEMEGNDETNDSDPVKEAVNEGKARKAEDAATRTMADDMAAMLDKWNGKGVSMKELSDARDVFNAYVDQRMEAAASAARDVTPSAPRLESEAA